MGHMSALRRGYPENFRMNLTQICRLSCLLVAAACLVGRAQADERDRAYRLGAFAGSMQYCQDRHDGAERRFRWAQLRAFQEISDLRRSDRLRALGARERALEQGRFFGQPLDSRSCGRLLRMGEWQRFRND